MSSSPSSVLARTTGSKGDDEGLLFDMYTRKRCGMLRADETVTCVPLARSALHSTLQELEASESYQPLTSNRLASGD